MALMNGFARNQIAKPTDIITKRSVEYLEHVDRWKFLYDSFEGGNRYRYATYGPPIEYRVDYARSVEGSIPERYRTIPVSQPYLLSRHNLIRHPREYPDPREPDNAIDDFMIRLDRTPVPNLVGRCVRKHIARIYRHEVSRKGSANITQWWKDVDGRRTSIDKWMRKTVAPLLLVLGQLDLIFDHPVAPDGEKVETRADAERLGLAACVAGYILPENMLWWKLLPNGRYKECLVREAAEDDLTVDTKELVTNLDTRWRFRHWTEDKWTLYDDKGAELGKGAHPFKVVPIVRVFDDRKARAKNVGMSRYESIAERQREVYNELSELILTNTIQAHPQLQGPPEYLEGDSDIPVGPGRILPKWFDEKTGRQMEWSVVSFPKEGAQFIRQSILDHSDEADRDAALTKPAGAVAHGVVSQSGVSKAFDFQEGNDLLSDLAETLAEAERTAAEFALTVLSDGDVSETDLDGTSVVYPRKFDLLTAVDLGGVVQTFQRLVTAAGNLPKIDADYLREMVRLMLPGRTDEEYAEYDKEITDWVVAQQARGPVGVPIQPGSPGLMGGEPGPGGPAGQPDQSSTEPQKLIGGKSAGQPSDVSQTSMEPHPLAPSVYAE